MKTSLPFSILQRTSSRSDVILAGRDIAIRYNFSKQGVLLKKLMSGLKWIQCLKFSGSDRMGKQWVITNDKKNLFTGNLRSHLDLRLPAASRCSFRYGVWRCWIKVDLSCPLILVFILEIISVQDCHDFLRWMSRQRTLPSTVLKLRLKTRRTPQSKRKSQGILLPFLSNHPHILCLHSSIPRSHPTLLGTRQGAAAQ